MEVPPDSVSAEVRNRPVAFLSEVVLNRLSDHADSEERRTERGPQDIRRVRRNSTDTQYSL